MLQLPLKYRYFVNLIVHFIKYVNKKPQNVLIKRNYHILVNNYDFMNQEGWCSLMRGIVFQTGIDALYVTLITENFDTKKSSKTKYLGVIELVMVFSRC